MVKKVKINDQVSYDVLYGLISRSTSDEKLWIADEWLRENQTISVDQYHSLRKHWDTMFKQYGTWKIVISCGTVHYDYAKGSYWDMYKICKDAHWKHNHNNGCVWDMEITEA